MKKDPLKADLHIHTAEDPYDYPKHSAYELIEEAAARGFEVLSITNHQGLTFSSHLQDFAREQGILLLPGVEVSIKSMHILLINADPRLDPTRLRSMADLRRIKNKDNLIIAPHPFYPTSASIGRELEKHLDLFDAVEHSYFYTKRMNFNRKAMRFAKEHQLPVVGTSDCHTLGQLGITFSLIEAEKDPLSVVQAVKEGKVKLETRPLSLVELFYFGFHVTLLSGKRKIFRRKLLMRNAGHRSSEDSRPAFLSRREERATSEKVPYKVPSQYFSQDTHSSNQRSKDRQKRRVEIR